jgi:hypothetical protein
MSQERLCNYFLLFVHQDVTDELNIHDIAKQFFSANDRRIAFFGTL